MGGMLAEELRGGRRIRGEGEEEEDQTTPKRGVGE